MIAAEPMAAYRLAIHLCAAEKGALSHWHFDAQSVVFMEARKVFIIGAVGGSNATLCDACQPGTYGALQYLVIHHETIIEPGA
jgi:hypothetical protein